MADSSVPKGWKVLALRAHFHLATARLLIDLALEAAPGEPVARHLRGAAAETIEAQDCVRVIAGAES